MAESLLWRDLTASQIEDYVSLKDKSEALDFINFHFGLGNDERSIILRDLYYYTIEFAKKARLQEEQTSVFFSIVKDTNSYVTSYSDINWARDYGYFKDLVLKHSINRPPISEKIFSYKEMLAIVDYVTNTYFRHYLLYKYAFTKKMKVEFVIENFMPVKSENIFQEEEEEQVQEQPDVEESPQEDEEPVDVEQSEEFVAPQEVLQDVVVPEEELPFKSPKHEAAVNELKSYITSVLSTKLDEIKATVSQKITAQEEMANQKLKEDEKKKAGGKPKK